MGNSLRILMVLLLVFAIGSPLSAFAEDLSPAQIKALEGAGVPVYPGANYLTGDDSDAATVMWFYTKDSPDKIMDWYKNNLPGWLELQANGTRLLYKGPGKIEAKDAPTRSYIFTITKDEETPDSKHSEITVRILK